MAPLLELNINKNGEFISAKITSIKQEKNKHMSVDPSGRAFQILKELTQTDIPEAELAFTSDGRIVRK